MRYIANQLIFTGDSIPASKAKDLGILFAVTEDTESLLKAGKELAGRLNDVSVYALIAAKKAIRFSAHESGTLAMEAESNIFNPLLDLSGSKEGVSAFIAKRKPDFKDK